MDKMAVDVFSGKSEITVRDLLEKGNCGRLGIPHFQRGLVWNQENVSQLLESLYLGTPCGTIILWKTSNPEHGQSLVGDSFDYLIVDGQQRVRSLIGIFMDSLGEQDDDEIGASIGSPAGIDKSADAEWGVYLPRLKSLEQSLENQGMNWPLFVKASRHRDKDGGPLWYPRNFVPLKMIPRGNYIDDLRSGVRVLLKGDGPEDVSMGRVKEALEQLYEKVMEQRLFLFVLQKASVPEIVGIYNRINSAGRRVQAEEKAFATLVSLYPETERMIREIFDEVHPQEAGGYLTAEREERDRALRPQRESAFGFKLFMRVFVLAANHRFMRPIGSTSLSYDVLNRSDVRERLRPETMKRLWEVTQRSVVCVARLLRDSLFCDDFRFLPDTFSLLPVFQLLLRYPRLLQDDSDFEAYRADLAWLIAALQFTELPWRGVLEMVASVQRSTGTLEQCLVDCRNRVVQKPYGLKDRIEKRLVDANTLQDRFTLLLYWLERKNEARDFLYVANDIDKIPDGEKRIMKACFPEKQHIVPYSQLRRIYPELKEKTRLPNHLVNNVGNLTYISQELNGFRIGLGDKFFDMEEENKQRPENARAHFVDDPSLRSQYAILKNKMKDPDGSLDTRISNSFDAFCRYRRSALAQAIVVWLDSFEREQVSKRTRVEPSPFDPEMLHEGNTHLLSVSDRIRLLDLHDEIEDALIRVATTEGVWEANKVNYGQRYNNKKNMLVLVARTSPGTAERKKERILIEVTGQCLRLEARGSDGSAEEALGVLVSLLSGKSVDFGHTVNPALVAEKLKRVAEFLGHLRR